MNRIDEPEGQGDERTWAPDESAEDFERASENVLDGWPTTSPGDPEHEPSDALSYSDEAEAEAEAGGPTSARTPMSRPTERRRTCSRTRTPPGLP